MYDEGIALGITEYQDLIDDAVNGLNSAANASLTASSAYNYDLNTEDDEKMDAIFSLLSVYLPQIAQKEGLNTKQLYNSLNRQLGWGVQ